MDLVADCDFELYSTQVLEDERRAAGDSHEVEFLNFPEQMFGEEFHIGLLFVFVFLAFFFSGVHSEINIIECNKVPEEIALIFNLLMKN